MDVPKSGEFAHIGKVVVIKGEFPEARPVSGRQVEGSILLKAQSHGLSQRPGESQRERQGVIVQGKLEATSRPATG